MAGPEATVVAAILADLRAQGFWAEKIHGSQFQAAGIPDILGFGAGRGFAIEVKAPGASATASEREAIASLRALGIPCGSAHGCTKLQALHIRRIVATGNAAGVATSVAEARAILGA